MRLLNTIVLSAIISSLFVPDQTSAANSSEFKVSSFIPEAFSDLEWTIGGGFNLSGSDNDSEQQALPGFQPEDSESSSSNGSQRARFDTDAIYRYETIARQFNLQLFIRGYLSHQTQDKNYWNTRAAGNINDSEFDRFQYQLGSNLRATGRQYFGDNLFGEISLSNDYTNDRTTKDDLHENSAFTYEYGDEIRVYAAFRDRERWSDRRNNSGSFAIAFGFGHIYEGSFASTAMHIIDQMEKTGLLRGTPDHKQMLGLTEIIYFYQMKHAVDSRIHRQEALNRIITFLENENIIQETNSEALYAIQDVWDYYPSRKSARRSFGYRVKAGVGYRVDYNRRSSFVDDHQYELVEQYDPDNPTVRDTISFSDYDSRSNYYRKSNNETPYLTLSVQYNRPINHRWQLDLSARAELNLDGDEPSLQQGQYLNDHHRVYSEVRLARFLDSRTTITTSLFSNLYFNRLDVEAHPSDTSYPDSRRAMSTDFTLTARCNITYRLALPTTLSLSAILNSNWTKEPGYDNDQNSDYKSFSLNAGISHYIF